MMGFAKGALVVLLALSSFVGIAFADTYRLTGQDRILLRAVHWDPDRAAYTPLEAVSGEYSIASDGTLLLPLIGEVMARGETTTSLAKILMQRLRRQAGFSELPDVGLEVIGHQPIYVLGAVASPGAYPFRPGLTAMQALALAGGPVRPPVGTPGGALNDAVRLEGELRSLADEIKRLQDQEQRLLADVGTLNNTAGSDADSSAATDALAAVSGLNSEILAATLAARKAQGERIQELQKVLRKQIESLTTQIALREDQIAQTRVELANVESLKDRGLTVNARLSALTSALNDLEAKRLQLDIARLTAQQQLNLAQRDELQLVDDARAKDLSQLNDLEGEIASRQIRLEAVRTLYTQAVASGLVTPEPDIPTETRYHVVRNLDGGQQSLDIAASDEVLPGDTVEISRVSTP